MFNIKISKTMKDIQWSFLSLATASFAHLLLRVFFGKEFGPAGLGLYTLVFTIYLFGMQFAGFGIGAALTRYVAEYKEDMKKINEFVSSGIMSSFLSGSLMLLVLFLFSNNISINLFHEREMIGLLKITALCFPFIAVQKVVLGILNGFSKMSQFSFLEILQNTLMVIFSFFFVSYLHLGVLGGVLGFVAPTVIVGSISLYLIKNYFVIHSVLLRDVLKELSWFGFYVVLANSIGMINTNIDSLMIGHFMNKTEVGYYSVSIIFIQGLMLLPSAIQRVTSPIITTYYAKKDYASIRKLIKNIMLKTFVIISLTSLFLAFFGKLIISLVFSEEFTPAWAPLLILLIGYSPYAALASIGGCLSSIGKVQIIFKLSIMCTIINIVLNIIFIPKFGLIGAASATSISTIFTTLINMYFIRKYT